MDPFTRTFTETTVAAFIVPVKTSRAVAGLAVPMPTLPFPRIVIIAVPLELLTNECVFAPAEKVFAVDAIRIPMAPEL